MYIFLKESDTTYLLLNLFFFLYVKFIEKYVRINNVKATQNPCHSNLIGKLKVILNLNC